MKVGFSFGRCVRDLVIGKVDYDDVLVIYAATNVKEEHLEQLVEEYTWRGDYLMGLDKDACLEMAKRLLNGAKIHQPRAFGCSPLRVRESGVWMDLSPTVIGDQENELVQKAWRDYQMALRLSTPEAIPQDQFKKRTPEEQAELDAAIDLLRGCI